MKSHKRHLKEEMLMVARKCAICRPANQQNSAITGAYGILKGFGIKNAKRRKNTAERRFF